MINGLWFHQNQTLLEKKVSIDEPWGYNIRSQIFCRNQEEHDYLSALNLIHGREIEIHIWDDWRQMRRELLSGGTRPRVLPIAYTTWYCCLKGF